MFGDYGGGATECYPGTNTLINKLSIKDQSVLENVESDIVNTRILDMEHITITNFDVSEYKSLHKYLFSDLYQWAGEFRQCDISKGFTRFCNWAYIEKEAKRLEAWTFPFESDDITQVAAVTSLYSDLNALHPFRDGNGRVTRLYIELLLTNYGLEVNWCGVNRDEWIYACIDSFRGNDDKLLKVFKRILTSFSP